MSDNLSPSDRKKTMRAVKGKGTTPEKRLSAMLAAMGVRGWKKNPSDIPGKPDVAFLDRKIAVFVDGCFWHHCPHCQKKLPKTNRAYWKRKIERNVSLARSYNRQLRRSGWKVIRIWEHEIGDRPRLLSRIAVLFQASEG